MPNPMTRIIVVICALTGVVISGEAHASENVSFLVIGDLPYKRDEITAIKTVIAPAIKQDDAAFLIHLGDFKQDNQACTNELLTKRRDQIYALLPGRVFLTPGDNDWTDCDRPMTGRSISELERLDFLRQLFFDKPLDLPPDWAYARQAGFPENARWIVGGVVFSTVHVVGTNNGRVDINKDDVDVALSLVEDRDAANLDWIAQAFAVAKSVQANAIVIANHADLTKNSNRAPCSERHKTDCDAYAIYRDHLIRNAAAFAGPVLLIHGDTPPYCLDKAFGGRQSPNLWRLNSTGDLGRTDPMKISVHTPNSTEPFTIETLLERQKPKTSCP